MSRIAPTSNTEAENELNSPQQQTWEYVEVMICDSQFNYLHGHADSMLVNNNSFIDDERYSVGVTVVEIEMR